MGKHGVSPIHRKKKHNFSFIINNQHRKNNINLIAPYFIDSGSSLANKLIIVFINQKALNCVSKKLLRTFIFANI